MRRSFSLAASLLSISLIPVCVSAQRGGGHAASGGAHFSGGGGAHFSGGRSMAMRSSSTHAAGGYRHSSGTHVTIRTVGPYNRGYGRYPYYAWGYPWGWYWDNGWYADNGYSSDSGDQDAYASNTQDAPPYSEPYMGNSGLHRDMQELNNKIDRLQADVEAKNRPKEQEPATALVFRDQHIEEVHNYAIAGGTLWVLSDASAKKIPLAQLDIPATVKMNDDRGVEFQIPQ